MLPENACISRVEQTLDPDMTLPERRHARYEKRASRVLYAAAAVAAAWGLAVVVLTALVGP